MKAVIMAGGEGTRLRPLTSRQPKPMLPLVNRPMMEHIVRLLKQHGFDDIVVTLAFLPDVVRNYFGDGSEFGVRMHYATEESPLGTAGSVLNAAEILDEPFLVISGDVLTDVDLSEMVRAHSESEATVTIGLKSVDNPLEFGIVITSDDGRVERFLEKPTWGQVFSDTVNTGIYVMNPDVFNHIPVAQASDFSADVFPRLLEKGDLIHGHVMEGYWEDVGTLGAYLTAHQDVLDGKVGIDIPGFRMENGVWLGEGCEVSPDAVIAGPAVIGQYATVAAGAHVGAYSVLGSNVRVGEDANLERCVVHDNAYLGEAAHVRGTILARAADVRHHARCDEGVVVGEETFVGDHATVSPDVKIYPHKEVEPGAVVNSSIVWEARAARNLFGRLGVAGLANVDITPELAVRVAMAFASALDKGTTVSVSRDSSRAARSIVRALVAGLNAAGANVLDLEVAPVPVTRFQVRSQRSQAGITVRLAPDDPQSVVIRFFDEDGHDVDEQTQRKIERMYHREEFRRVAASEIGDIGFPSRSIEYYTEALVSTVAINDIREQKFKVVLDYAYGSPSFVMPNVLAKLDAEVLTVNPFASTRSMLRFDRDEHSSRVGSLVQASGAQFGAVFDPAGETIQFIDDSGHVLSDEECRLALITLVGMTVGPGSTIALPVSAPLAAERLALEYGMDVVWTKLADSDLMEKAGATEVVFAGSRSGGYIFPSFVPAYDAINAFVNMAALLAKTSTSLSEVVAKLPKVNLAHETVSTPWDQKGSLMRQLVESIRDKTLVLVDGIKVVEDESSWVLVIPDPDRPVTHVWAEAGAARDARGLAQQYVRQIRHAMRST